MMLAGVAVKNAASKWSLQLLISNQKPNEVATSPTESSTKPEKSDRKKKTEKKEDSFEPTPTK